MNEPDDDFDEWFDDWWESIQGDQERYPEEDLAENLHDRLNEQVASRLEGTAVVLTPMGVNSYCRAERGRRASTIFCFDTAGQQFLARFEENPATPLWGRTFVQAEVLEAVGAWLEGALPGDLCARFPFIERQRRVLGHLQQILLTVEPALVELTTHELASSEWGGEGCNLWFHTKDRSCEVYFYAYNGIPDARFYWDSCFQFGAQMAEVPHSKIRTEEDFLRALRAGELGSSEIHRELDATKTVLLAEIMKRWLCDQVMPSAIQREYPWIVLSDLAPYYEQGRGVEGEFITSWRHVEERYKDLGQPCGSQVLQFVRQLRGAGYERTFRAGTSLTSLLVSRARRHGLKHKFANEQYDPRKHDPFVVFDFGGVEEGKMKVTACLDDGEQSVLYPTIEFTPHLDTLLKRLEAIPIR